ncbi:hypothetical protein EZV73_19630 [Acidaminobacter sp. JC074]|uniref:sensor histidine kinase n=1 Tax=Acidaminobacter sp. JC074 TaxID=2530199 RepID=UPI001F0FD34B|nr:sensor histidine kinase [Acidaminobacter sp. JC074]MCH4889804.1 hypothetical protein [Acidaminobacter sp. JC074]
MKYSLKIKSILNSLFLAVVIVPLFIITFVALGYTRSYIVEMTMDYNQQIMNNIQNNIETFFEEPRRDMRLMRDSILLNDGNINSEFAESFINNRRYFHHILLIDGDGTVLQTYPDTDDIIGFDYSRETAFEKIAAGQSEAWSRTYIYTRENLVSVNYAVPMGDKVLLGIIHLSAIEHELIENINDPDLLVGVTNSSGVYIMHSDYNQVVQRVTDPHVLGDSLDFESVTYNSKRYYASMRETEYQGWRIIIYEPYDRLQQRIVKYITYLSIIIIGLASISTILGRKVFDIVFKNLDQVVTNTKSVAEGHYAIADEDSVFIEFNEINKNFRHMASEVKTREDLILNQSYEIEQMNRELENRVIERTNELFSTNQELEIALENLKLTQEQLIESEKLASLGDLVAGLAHEINTPLGIILTIVTYLQESTGKVKEKYDSGLLKKGDFEQHLKASLESESLIYDNINRAIELISSFKLISAEQRNIEKREILLYEFLENIIKSLEPQMKKNNIQIRLECSKTIEIETIPLSLYQIIINLVMNAKIHAYDLVGGYVDIHVTEMTDYVRVSLKDYGRGIEPDNIKKIFDPFFTTRRGAGGTGLGLNIVYNSVKQNLQGNISCVSELGQGTEFIIDLPFNLE